jgi:hypothetical protein
MPDAATDDVHAGGREDDRVVFIRVFDQFARAKGQANGFFTGSGVSPPCWSLRAVSG